MAMVIQGQNSMLYSGSIKQEERTVPISHQTEHTEKNTLDGESYRVTISEEGERQYRDSLKQTQESGPKRHEEGTWAYKMSNSVIDVKGRIESDLHKRYIGLNTETGKENCEAGDFAGRLLSAYTDMYDEIKRGYADGTRELWMADDTAPDGFRRVTEEEELTALDEAMDFQALITDSNLNYGKKAGIMARAAVEGTWENINNQKNTNRSSYKETEGIENFRQDLRQSVNAVKKGYTVHAHNLPFLVDGVMQKMFS